ncbi:hypothetical protein ACULLL_10975 [Lysinibacillus irui]|uniref:hypothetical protein n=1 Tax=Lysinibacillus irui TaxID=2998077 RepID=UPI0040448C19
MLRVMLVTFLAVFLFGCNEERLPGGELTKVSLSIGAEFGQVNTDFMVIYEDEKSLHLFQQAISTAVKNEGVVDMALPEYDIQLLDTAGNKYGYHLWLGENGQSSVLMNTKDTHTIYTVSKDYTEALIALVRQ